MYGWESDQANEKYGKSVNTIYRKIKSNCSIITEMIIEMKA